MGGFSQKKKFRAIKEAARAHLTSHRPDLVITGMAVGWDQWIANICIEENIPFVAALPCEGQENKWPPKAQQHYAWLLSRAAKIVQVDREPGYISNIVRPGVYHPTKMITRNHWMIDQIQNGDILFSLWDGRTKGGTYATIDYFVGGGPGHPRHINLVPSDFDDVPF